MTYQELVQKIVDLQNDGLELFNAGKSVLGKNLLGTHLGSYEGNQIVIQGCIHAREYITTLLMIEQVKYLHSQGLNVSGGIYFLFMTDPDGVEIVLDGINSAPCEITKQYLILGNNNSTNFSQYKANINQVDLNTNFDADWGQGTQNVFCPNSENFCGFYPESEREVQGLVNFTLKNRPLLTISYHSKGEVIYYGFQGESAENLERDRQIGTRLSEETGYQLILTENSTGGYKDWCIRKLQIPAYTIEVGRSELPHPIGIEYLPEIFEQNRYVPELALGLANEYASQIKSAKIVNINTKERKIKNDSYARSGFNGAKSFQNRRSTSWSSNHQK
ncbi:MAG: M14 family zinc carboxypeptidase [Clostridia bacterium]|nr:M14 family zinc carboxypeptidase [Clostridia bacterium]